jgi:hypothetical protein
MTTYDMTKAVDALAPALDPAHPEYDGSYKNILEHTLSLPDFAGYAAAYFKNIPINEARNHIKSHNLPSTSPLSVSAAHEAFASGNPRADQYASPANRADIALGGMTTSFPPARVRKNSLYPLTLEEAKQAVSFMRANPDYHLTLGAIRNCIAEYIDDLEYEACKKYQIPQGLEFASHDFATIISTLDSLMDIPSITQDLGPILAHTLRTEPEPFTPGAMRRAFHEVFQRQAFQSSKYDVIDNRLKFKYTRCPFAHPLMQIMSLDLREDGEGNLTAVPTQTPGALLISLRERLRAQNPDIGDKPAQAQAVPVITDLYTIPIAAL